MYAVAPNEHRPEVILCLQEAICQTIWLCTCCSNLSRSNNRKSRELAQKDIGTLQQVLLPLLFTMLFCTNSINANITPHSGNSVLFRRYVTWSLFSCTLRGKTVYMYCLKPVNPVISLYLICIIPYFSVTSPGRYFRTQPGKKILLNSG